MTGQELYEMYAETLDRLNNCGCDPYVEIEQNDKDVWDDMAKRLVNGALLQTIRRAHDGSVYIGAECIVPSGNMIVGEKCNDYADGRSIKKSDESL